MSFGFCAIPGNIQGLCGALCSRITPGGRLMGPYWVLRIKSGSFSYKANILPTVLSLLIPCFILGKKRRAQASNVQWIHLGQKALYSGYMEGPRL